MAFDKNKFISFIAAIFLLVSFSGASQAHENNSKPFNHYNLSFTLVLSSFKSVDDAKIYVKKINKMKRHSKIKLAVVPNTHSGKYKYSVRAVSLSKHSATLLKNEFEADGISSGAFIYIENKQRKSNNNLKKSELIENKKINSADDFPQTLVKAVEPPVAIENKIPQEIISVEVVRQSVRVAALSMESLDLPTVVVGNDGVSYYTSPNLTLADFYKKKNNNGCVVSRKLRKDESPPVGVEAYKWNENGTPCQLMLFSDNE